MNAEFFKNAGRITGVLLAGAALGSCRDSYLDVSVEVSANVGVVKDINYPYTPIPDTHAEQLAKSVTVSRNGFFEVVCGNNRSFGKYNEAEVGFTVPLYGNTVDIQRIRRDRNNSIRSAETIGHVRKKQFEGTRLKGMEIFIDDNSKKQIESQPVPDLTKVFSASDFAPGPHTVVCFSTDKAGRSYSDEVKVTIMPE